MSQYKHYFIWGGRAPAHILAQFFLMLPTKKIFDVFNSIVFLLMLIGIYLNIDKKLRKKQNPLFVFIIILFLVWFFVSRIGETIFWVTGSFNYLWMSTICLFFVCIFKNILFNYQKHSNNIINFSSYFLLFLFGILSGWTNENMGLSILVASLVLMYVKKIKNKKVIIMLIGILIGSLFLILAPGNFQRIAYNQNNGSFVKTLLTYKLSKKIGFIILFLSFFSYVRFGKQKICEKFRKHFYEILIAFFAFGLMLTSPEFPLRARMGAQIFVFIFILNILLEINFSKNKFFQKNILKAIILTFLLGFLLSFFYVFDDYKNVYFQMKERTKLISESGKEVLLPSLTRNNKRFIYLVNSTISQNDFVARNSGYYYHKEKFIVLPRDVYFNLYLNDNADKNFQKYNFKMQSSIFQKIYITKIKVEKKNVFMLQLRKELSLDDIESITLETIKKKKSNYHVINMDEVFKTKDGKIIFMKILDESSSNFEYLGLETKIKEVSLKKIKKYDIKKDTSFTF
ncbi:MAG: DUF6056 family protein, partial [Fusobacteriaceae bacterium]